MNEIILKRHYGLVPATMGEAMKLAEMMASAKLVPAALQKSPADCLMVIQQAIRWDMDPFAVAQECSVIQGKLMLSGKLVAAVVNARGNLTDRLSFRYSGSGDDRTITVSGQLQGEDTPRTVEISLKNAKTANSIWGKQPDQQLMYHGARVWARRHTPELVLGVWSEEEFDAGSVEHRRPPPPAPNPLSQQGAGAMQAVEPYLPKVDDTSEAPPPDKPPPNDDEIAELQNEAREAAKRGEKFFKDYYKDCSPEEREVLAAIGDELRRLMS